MSYYLSYIICLLVKTIASEDASKASYLEPNYVTEINISRFSTVEADILRTIFRESKPDFFRDIIDEVESLRKGQLCLLPNAVKILELLLVNPATTATSERPFSLARRIKTWLRSTSTAACFNSLLMSISPSLMQLIWFRSQMNSHQNAILEKVFSGGFKMT